MFTAFVAAIVVTCILGAIFAMGLTRNRFMAKTFVALAIVALGVSMAACASACGTAQLVYSQQLVAAPLNYAPIVAPLAQYVPPVTQQFVAPAPLVQQYSQPVFSAPVVRAYSAPVVAAQLRVKSAAVAAPVAAVKVRPIRFPNLPRNKAAAVVAPVVAPVVGY